MDNEMTELLSGARDGDMTAFRLLVDRCSRRVHSIAYRMTGNAEDARDIAQETFIRIHQSLAIIDDTQSFQGWLYRTTVNLALDFHRVKKRYAVVSLEGVGGEITAGTILPDTASENAEMAAIVRIVVRMLTPKQREVFVLRDIEGFSTEEIASLLNLNQSTIRVHLAKARERMKRELLKRYPNYFNTVKQPGGHI
ncbi:RNA polymerase sigma factor [bacterium]|nr:RNA polymerase sigma factor [bacterium]